MFHGRPVLDVEPECSEGWILNISLADYKGGYMCLVRDSSLLMRFYEVRYCLK